MHRSILTLTALLTPGLSQLYPGTSNLNHTCAIQPALLSCPPQNPLDVDTCCTETFGGLLLSTQFWSTYTGLEDEGQLLPPQQWTLHGLWPDFCNGSYTQYCDLTRQYDPVPAPNTTTGTPDGTPVPPWTGATIGSFVEKFGRYDLLAWMNKYWVNQGGSNDEFWAHEFSKHATCFSTFDVPCYGPKYVEHEEIVDFFDTTIMYYQKVPTFKWLAEKGIKPSNDTGVSLGDLQDALIDGYGALPYIGCSGQRYNETNAGMGGEDTGRTVVSEVWYYKYVSL
jgi:ribonuclease T2